MTRKLTTKRVDRAQAGTYLHKARGFRANVEAMAALQGEFSGNGLAVLCVHAAIAYADALAVRAGEASPRAASTSTRWTCSNRWCASRATQTGRP